MTYREQPDNYEQKCLCVLVLDTSGSMQGPPIAQLNQGLQDFYADIHNDSTTSSRLEICIVEFNSDVMCIQEPSLVSNFSMPYLDVTGTTKLVDGVRMAMRKVHERKTWYRSTGQKFYRPWIVLMTDGAPDPNQDVNGLARELEEGSINKHFNFFAIGVQGADMAMLQKISPSSRPPAQLQGLRFAEFFEWLSASLSQASGSEPGTSLQLPDTGTWGTIMID
jgi:uncharacterized protein YegL